MGEYSRLLIGAVALIALILLIKVFSRGQSVSVSGIRSALTGIGKKHILLLFLAALFGCGTFYLDYCEVQKSASVIVSLNFAEASNGEDFDGTRYNMSEIISDEVIERAIQDGGFENVTAEQLAGCLSISPLVQGDAYHEQSYHISTEFVIGYSPKEETSHLDARNVVQMVAQAYKSLYIERFTSTFDLLKLAEDVSFDGMEYLDAVMYLDKECSKLEYYMLSMRDENSSFRDSNGNTFAGLASKIDMLRDVQINENLRSYIVQNSVCRNAEGYINRLEYDNALMKYEMEKDEASFVIRNEAIAKYDEAMSRIVLVPTWASDGEFYMGRTKIGPDELSMDAYGFSADVAGWMKKIEENNQIISAMRTGSSSRADAVEDMIERIYSTMIKYSQEAWNLTQEYSETQMNQCLSISEPKISYKRMLVFNGAGAVMFYGMLVLAIISGKLKKELKKDQPRRQPAR